ncbi:MAG TPA: hypothetical protein VKT00_11040 [Casimicrobiaceae bacterium]|nr:hypothetical protein [Casimicrobiaceae bacterium]
MAIPSTLRIAAAVLLSFAVAASAHAARIAVVSNAFSAATAANFSARIPGDTFTGIDVSTSVPSLDTLLANYDVILLFEDSTFTNATAVGTVVAAFANAGRAVVLGTFYDQDRSDATAGSIVPHGWGSLEQIDPNTTDGIGTAYAVRTLNPAAIVPSPLTQGVASLSALRGNPGPYAGGNQAKPGTTVVATWSQPNARGLPDPAIAYRITGRACVIQIGIAAQYPVLATYSTFGTDFGGDFYQVWKNAFDFGAAGCPTGIVPGDPNQIAKGWENRQQLDLWRAKFRFAILLDGVSIQSGFGPALRLTTHPDGTITFG